MSELIRLFFFTETYSLFTRHNIYYLMGSILKNVSTSTCEFGVPLIVCGVWALYVIINNVLQFYSNLQMGWKVHPNLQINSTWI